MFQFKCSYPCSKGELSSPSINTEECSVLKKVVPWYDVEEWERGFGLDANLKQLPVINPENVSYSDFFSRFLVKNLPCMFSAEITSSWLSRQTWMAGECEMFDNLVEIYRDTSISAVNCDDPEYKDGYGARDCRDMSFTAYIEYWRDYIDSGYSSEKPCLYLKDWHIVKFHESNALPQLPYVTPSYFQSDWLNEACDNKNGDDFKFCYMGPKDSFTSFHADVYGSYSWSANVVGVKKWYLYPPGKELRFFDSGKMKFNWNDLGIPGEDYIEVIQKAGECIFVPSGWHHVVWNLKDTISINHNWFNGANVCYIWNVLQNALKDVKRELDDLKGIPEFGEQCQLILKANHGMDYEAFFDVLKIICKNRQKQGTPSPQSAYDLEAVKHLIEEHCTLDPDVTVHFSDEMFWFTDFYNNA